MSPEPAHPPRYAPTSPSHAAQPDALPRSWASEAIFQGDREVVIRHGAETYRLRVTSSNKLILTK